MCPGCGFKNQSDEKFCGGCGIKLTTDRESVSIAQQVVDSEEPTSAGAERRQLTVMFCDLADSTRMSTHMDPEDLNRLNRDYQNICTRVIEQFSGFVARYMGDGILSYFGYPVAHENDAENAILSALELHRQIAALNPDNYQGERLSVRVGIATGPVVVGDVVGEGAARESTAVGQTPNLAARLQEISPPGGVVIADQTHNLAGALFEYKDLGPVDIKGMQDPVHLWQVVMQKSTVTRFDALSGSKLTPMVGRQHELNLTRDCWEQTSCGSGQVIMLCGEPGIGKSRLIQNISTQSPKSDLRILQSSPNNRSSTLYSITEYLNRYLTKNYERSKPGLQQLLSGHGLDKDGAEELLSELLFNEDSERFSTQTTAQQRKQKLLYLLQQLLTASEDDRPVMLVFEDLHWVDPTTQELLNALVPFIVDKPVLMVVTYRPEYVSNWTGQAHVHLLSLNRINQNQCNEMVKSIAGEQFSMMLAEQIVKRTDGVPLFVEELTRAVLASKTQFNEGVVNIDVPATLADLLNARLDRLGATRRVAQAGAVIGRNFNRELLKVVTGQSGDELDAHIVSLLESGLVFQFGSGEDLHFQFKHTLVQDAAYASLLRDQQKKFHRRVADYLANAQNSDVSDSITSRAEVVARHYTEAGIVDKAIEYWILSGNRSSQRYANIEAIQHYQAALSLLDQLADPVSAKKVELDLRLKMSVPLIAIHGFGSEVVEECGKRARQIGSEIGDQPRQFAAGRLVWNSSLMRQPIERSIELGSDLIKLADDSNDPAQRAIALRALGYSTSMYGDQQEASRILQRSFEIADELLDEDFVIYGEHPSVICRLYCGWALSLQGNSDTALMLAQQATDLERQKSNPHSLAWCLVVVSWINSFLRNTEATRELAKEARSLSEKYVLPQWMAFSHFLHGWSISQLGRKEGFSPR